MPLEEYEKKRDFTRTDEPKPKKKKASRERKNSRGEKKQSDKSDETKLEGLERKKIFIIQRHSARRLHHDFRLESGGVLKSWAVPKGLPKLGEKRLAVETEDHPMEYAAFEGTIPEGEYGAGTVKIHEKGYFVNITIKQGKQVPLGKAIADGHFLVWLKGKHLEGGYALTKLDRGGEEHRPGKNTGKISKTQKVQAAGKDWLIVRINETPILKSDVREDSVTIEGKTIMFTNQDKQLDAGITKGEFIKYYLDVRKLMLPHVKGRYISMYRFPEGVGGDRRFYQKNIPSYFPGWVKTEAIQQGKKKVRYIICEDEKTLAYLANQVAVLHISADRIEKKGMPDRMVFDLDPASEARTQLPALKKAAENLKEFLEDLGFTPYIMTTGGKGYHIVMPIKTDSQFEEIREFAKKIADAFIKSDPNNLTTEFIIDKRKGKIFIDTNRNADAQTAVAPYSIRARPGLPIAKPFYWEELDKTDPQTYSIADVDDIKDQEDPWKDMYKHAVSIRRIKEKLLKKN